MCVVDRLPPAVLVVPRGVVGPGDSAGFCLRSCVWCVCMSLCVCSQQVAPLVDLRGENVQGTCDKGLGVMCFVVFVAEAGHRVKVKDEAG